MSKAQSWAGETHHQGARTEGQPFPQGPRNTSLGFYKLGNTDIKMLCLCVWLENPDNDQGQQLNDIPSQKSEHRPSVVDIKFHVGHKFNKLGFTVSQFQEFSSSM